MKRLAVLRRTTEPHGWQQTVVPLVVVLSLALGTLGIDPAMAATPPSTRIVQNPATTVRTLSPGESGKSASEEVWINSDEGPSATKERTESKVAETEPTPRARATFSVSHPSDSPGVSPLAATILRYRMPSPSASVPAESEKTGTPRNPQGEELATGAKAALPASTPKAVASQTPESSAASDRSQAGLGREDASQTVQLDPSSKRDGDASPPRSPQADESLFRTTSCPVKPAASVFRPSPQSDASEGVPASSEESQPGLQVPSNPTAQPELQTPLARDRHFQVAQFQSPFHGSNTSRNVASSVPVTGSEKPVEHAMPSVDGGQPSLEARFVSPDTPPSASYQRESMRPGERSAGTRRTASAPPVILRVRVAELNRASAKKWGLANLGFSQRPPLLRSLTEADPGQGPILLDLQGNDELESQLQSLKEEGILRIRSEPTLVTASGRPARFATGRGSSDFIAGPDVQPSVETGTLGTDVTLLPLVADRGDVLLEVTCTSSVPYFETDADENTAPRNQRRQMKVRIRPGQTLAVTGLGLEPSQEEPGQGPNTIARVLGLGKPKGKQPETVMFITPELVGAPPASPAATLAGHAASVPARSRPWVESPEPEDHDVAKPPGSGEFVEEDGATESSPSNPLVKFWRMAKSKIPQGKSSELR